MNQTSASETGRRSSHVLLDTSALEACYLPPLLGGHTCRDIAAIGEHGYTPAVLQKTLSEVWLHAKLGTGNSALWASQSEYPGPIGRMVEAITRAEKGVDAHDTAWLWFNLAEEWATTRHVQSGVRREFFQWKQAVTRFCQGIEHTLRSAGVAIVGPLQVLDAEKRDAAAEMERELALHSLLPNEDSAWVLDALLVGARAIVTCDRSLIGRGRLSMGLNIRAPSTVHPTRLPEALHDGFRWGTYQEER